MGVDDWGGLVVADGSQRLTRHTRAYVHVYTCMHTCIHICIVTRNWRADSLSVLPEGLPVEGVLGHELVRRHELRCGV